VTVAKAGTHGPEYAAHSDSVFRDDVISFVRDINVLAAGIEGAYNLWVYRPNGFVRTFLDNSIGQTVTVPGGGSSQLTLSLATSGGGMTFRRPVQISSGDLRGARKPGRTDQ
jgi:hypothetical protein